MHLVFIVLFPTADFWAHDIPKVPIINELGPNYRIEHEQPTFTCAIDLKISREEEDDEESNA